MGSDDNRAAALANARETEREASERENAELCQWLGIPATDTCYCERTCCCIGNPIYPALATREGFWPLLKAVWKWKPAMHADDAGFTVFLEGDTGDDYEQRIRPELPAAIYAAAVALMRRERGE
jgi:hypothetical protein